RLRSRFEWGLITDIQPPDLETREAILRRKVKSDGIDVGDPEVLTFVASRVSTNIRELEGALTRVIAFSSLTGRRMDVELAQDVLAGGVPEGPRRGRRARRYQGPRPGAFLGPPGGPPGRPPLSEHRLPAAGRDVSLARADGFLTTEDRQGVRRPRSHDGHPCN